MKSIFLFTILLTLQLSGEAFSQQIKVASIGNSITYGSGMPNPSKTSYPAQLQYWLGKDYDVRNFGVSGCTLLRKGNNPYWKRDEYTRALDFNPDIVLIKLGTNDSKPQNWQFGSEFKQDYLDMISSFKNLSSNPRIILMLPVPVFTAEKWGIRDSVVSKIIIPEIKEIAKESGCELIDLHTPLLEYGHFFPDQVHPDPLGANLMVEIIYRKLSNNKYDADNPFNPCTLPVPSFEFRSGAGWGEGNDWFSQFEAINKMGENRDVNMVFLGNSITQSWGGEGREVWSPVKQLWDSLYQPLNAGNFGISGDRTQHIIWRIQNGNFDNIKPKLVVLAIGVNNFRHNTAEEIALGIEAVVRNLKSKTPSSEILLIGPFPAGATKTDPMRIKYNIVHELIASLGNLKKVTYKNIGQTYILDNGNLNYEFMRKDNIHLAPKGYHLWAESIQEEVDKVFRKK